MIELIDEFYSADLSKDTMRHVEVWTKGVEGLFGGERGTGVCQEGKVQ